MEEQRISRMYWALTMRRLESAGRFLFGSGFRGSSLFPVLVVLLLVGLPVVAFVLHRHAKFHDLRQQIKGDTYSAPTGPQPGGRDPVVLTRTATQSDVPQFLSVTLLPGLGMDVLQITAALPGRGETPLLLAPTAQQLADASAPSSIGPNDNRGAIELPWGGGLEGVTSMLGTTVATEWSGHSISVPTESRVGPGLAIGGLLLSQDTDSVSRGTAADGSMSGIGRFAATDFNGHWFSQSQTTVSVTLAATTLDLDVAVQNTGEQPEPLGVGWHPRFALNGTDRRNVVLAMPNGDRAELGSKPPEMPTGKLLGRGEAGEHPNGEIGLSGLDAVFVHLKSASTEAGPMAEMLATSAGYGVRLRPLTANTSEMRVYSPAGADFVALGAQSNLDNPFGHIWPAGDSPIQVLAPGEILHWKVRLELFALPHRGLAPHYPEMRRDDHPS